MTRNYETHGKKEKPRPTMCIEYKSEMVRYLLKDSFYLPVLNLPQFCLMFFRLWNEGEWNLVPHISSIARHFGVWTSDKRIAVGQGFCRYSSRVTYWVHYKWCHRFHDI